MAAAKARGKATATRSKKTPSRGTQKKETKAVPRGRAVVSIELPKRLGDALGATPAKAIAELLALRDALGGIPVDRILKNPFLRVELDENAKFQPFATSALVELRPLRCTERELLEEAIRVSGRRADQIAHAGVIREAASDVQADHRRRKVLPEQDASRFGVEGIRDEELLKALNELKALGKPISASALRTHTGIAFRTCARFLERRGVSLGLTQAASGYWVWKGEVNG